MQRTKRLATVCGVFLAAALIAASCGDDDGGGSASETPGAPADEEMPEPEMVETVPMDEWVDMANELCAETREAAASVPEPQTLEDVAPALSTAAQSAHQFTEDLIAIGTPDSDLSGVLTYIDFSWKVADLLDEASATAEDDPEMALTEIDEVEELGLAGDLVAREIGITGCYEIEPVGEAELLDLSEFIPPVPPTPEEMVAGLVEAGYTTAEAECLTDRRNQLPDLSDDDFEEKMTAFLIECGIDIERAVTIALGER